MVDGALVDTRLFLGGIFCVTVAAWLAVIRAVASGSRCRPRFCSQCGFDIAARLARRDPVPLARPVSVGVESRRRVGRVALGLAPSGMEPHRVTRRRRCWPSGVFRQPRRPFLHDLGSGQSRLRSRITALGIILRELAIRAARTVRKRSADSEMEPFCPQSGNGGFSSRRSRA